MAATPVPLLELPVQAAMVRAVAKVHGVEGNARPLLPRLAAALGLGFMIHEGLRWILFGGGISRLSRVYGATWALGQAADLYFARAARTQALPDPARARRAFEETSRRKSREQAGRLEEGDVLGRLKALKTERETERIGEAEYRSRLEELLSGL
jgi:uncharacterized protein (DUF697 family)